MRMMTASDGRVATGGRRLHGDVDFTLTLQTGSIISLPSRYEERAADDRKAELFPSRERR